MDHAKRYPPGIPYIIGNEGCERFSYYGMRAILFVYMVSLFGQQLAQKAAEDKATNRIHLFFAGVYAFPMIGAIISDRLLGKYRTIFWLSLVYCMGHAALAVVGTTEYGLYFGLALIALGSGGIKPCVSAQVGDQFSAENESLVTNVYQAFYFIINFGSFFATLLIPVLLAEYGSEVAFGVPGILMFIATVVMWMGRNKFIRVPPKPGGKLGLLDTFSSVALFMTFGSLFFTSGASLVVRIGVGAACFALGAVLFAVRQGIEQDSGFLAVLVYSLQNQAKKKPGEGFFSVAREKFGDEAAEGPPAVIRIAIVFSMVSVFWALFDQHASSWINQAGKMNLTVNLPIVGEKTLKASQIAALNPLMVMLIIPFLNFAVYPVLTKLGLKLTPLRKMASGMFLTAFSFIVVALLQARIEALAAAGEKVTVLWHILPYLIITTAEVLVSATGLEFAYTQAPRSMKSTIMGFWLLAVTLGNLLVAFLAGFSALSLEQFFWTFAGLMAVAAAIFSVLAHFYKEKTYLQAAR
ncbi:MAG: MFS transporter [Deltaproteobacteria bacterium]|nr:MFS transporter [Deltaproteobacteria bacterium]